MTTRTEITRAAWTACVALAATLAAATTLTAQEAEPPADQTVDQAQGATQPTTADPVQVPDLGSGGSLVIEATGFRSPPPPLFFSARTGSEVTLSADGWELTAQVTLTVLQGKPDVFSIGLHGGGEVVSVEGDGVLDWAVRHAAGGGGNERILEVRPAAAAGGGDRGRLDVTVRVAGDLPELPGNVSVATFGPGKAVGFSSLVTLRADESVDVTVASSDGLVPVDGPAPERRTWRFHSSGESTLDLAVAPGGAARADVEFSRLVLEGTAEPGSNSVAFVLTGEAEVTREGGGRTAVLSGHAAIGSLPPGNEYAVELVAPEGEPAVYELVFPRAGRFPVRLEFQAGILGRSPWQALDFTVPAGAVVPVRIRGLAAELRFDPGLAVFPTPSAGAWNGFLPADGRCSLAWQPARDAEVGKLFFASEATTETRVAAGLLRQSTTVVLSVLQGELDGVAFEIVGDGEILSVEGENVIGWSVGDAPESGGRLLSVETGRPVTGSETVVVKSQAPLGDFPLAAEPLRLTPAGAVRHSGFVRVASEGAVRIEVSGVSGMTQVAPEMFPGAADDGAGESIRQVFVYRFPSAAHAYTVNADQVLPEVGVSQIAVYEMTETDRVIAAQLELDIREAPLREWELAIPDGFAVVGVQGAEVADYVLGSTAAAGGTRSLRVVFGGPVSGRQLVVLRLEQNTAAAAGPWVLPPLAFPGAKSVRGHVAAAAAPGYRLAPAETTGLTEVPLAYFPTRMPNLQQAFRLRGGDWTATMTVEALPQSVQADVFHLYSLKEGIAYGSVLVNYFVVGAPVSEWRLAVPESVGNVAIEGQNVQGWRQEGGEVVVTLHQPALGASTLLLTFEQPMSARGDVLRPGEVAPAGVQGERGLIHVVSPGQVKQEVTAASPGLVKLEPLEIPAEFRILTSAPTLAAYQYSSRPFDLQLRIGWFEPGQSVDQVVDFAELKSQVSGDGQVVTDSRFFVKTRGRKALALRLPPGVELWEARVGGAPVSARADGDTTLVPLAASADPNTPVEVLVRTGQTGGDKRHPVVSAPVVLSPTLIANWRIGGDPGKRLVPAGGAPALARPSQTEDGFEWLRNRGGWLAGAVAVLGLLGAALGRRGGGAVRWLLGVACGSAAVAGAAIATVVAAQDRRAPEPVLEFVSPVLEPGQELSVPLRNVGPWEAAVSWPGVAVALAGVALVLWARSGSGRSRLLPLGWVAVGVGTLMQHGGAVPFFVLVTALLVSAGLARGWWDLRRKKEPGTAGPDGPPPAPGDNPDKGTKPDPGPGSGTGAGGAKPKPSGATAALVAPAALLGALATLAGSAPNANAAPAPARVADAIEQQLTVRDGRVYAEMSLRATGRESDTLFLLGAPAVLTKFEGDGLRVTRRGGEGETSYWLVFERDGEVRASAAYELAAPEPENGFVLPVGAAAVHTIDVRYDKPGWQLGSPQAVRTGPSKTPATTGSSAGLVLAPAAAPLITFTPRGRDFEGEEAVFFAEVANLFSPGPGFVDGRHRVTVRPSRGQVRGLEISVPPNLTVGSVGGDCVGTWRFDPESAMLFVEVTPAQANPFTVDVVTQAGTDPLPTAVTLAPLDVEGAESQFGMVGLAFGPDAQPGTVTPDGMSSVNTDDFDASLVAGGGEGQTLQQAYLYGEEGGTLAVEVNPVAPEVRVASRQTLSVGDERLVLAVDLNATITRAGLFKLSFALPDGLEVEGASGDALSHWTESLQDGTRVVTLHLNGRTLGDQAFSLSLAGPAPGAQAAWPVPRVELREATRQTGQLLVVPEQGIRVRAVDRQDVSQLDARTIAGERPGALAFRLLQAGWNLTLQLEELDPWVTAQSLQEVTVREGLTKTHVRLRCRVENAAIKALRVRIPALGADDENTVRASGPAVGDIVRVEGEADVWEVRFQRRIIGDTEIEIDFQTTQGGGAGGVEAGSRPVNPVTLPGVAQAASWVAVRVSGHLQVQAAPAGSGWQQVDWPAVPRDLVNPRDRSVAALAFRVVEPENPLVLDVRRHAVAGALSLRVSSAWLTTAFALEGNSVTEAELAVEVVEKSTLRVRLPAGAELLSTFVNGQGAAVVREDDAYLFYVIPKEEERSASVTLAWTMPPSLTSGRRLHLAAPSFNVPLQDISWNVVLPEGYTLISADGTLDLRSRGETLRYRVDDYKHRSLERRSKLARDANQLFEDANRWKVEGDQGKARSALSKLANTTALDEAANEDARVQLRELQTQQAVVGLNTRRQRFYFDNAGENPAFARNELLEQAAVANPILQGELNYDPQQVEGLLRGNTAEENSALQRIAGRIVNQQLAAEPAPQAIDITLPLHGELARFNRSIQVDGATPLELELRVGREDNTPGWFAAAVTAALALLAWLCFAPGRQEEDETPAEA